MPPIGTSSIPAASMMSASASMPSAQSMPGFGGFGTNTGFPSPPASMHDLGASGSVAAVADPSQASARKRMIVVVAAAALAVVAGFLLVIMLAGGKAKKTGGGGKGSALIEKGSSGSAEHQVAMGIPDAAIDEGSAAEGSAAEGSAAEGSGGGSQQVEIQPPDQGSNATPPNPDGPCHVEVTSVPTGADVYLAKTKLGTTPGTFDLPCGAPSTLSLKKPKFLATDKTFTPSADKPTKVVVKLGKTMLSLKVTSSPSGATITINGKSAGVTPATVKVAGFEANTITLSKPGFAKDTQRVTPKNNGQAHHVVLKKGR